MNYQKKIIFLGENNDVVLPAVGAVLAARSRSVFLINVKLEFEK